MSKDKEVVVQVNVKPDSECELDEICLNEPLDELKYDDVDEEEEVPLLWIAKALTWKDECKHTETMVHYREDVASGDFIVWKEICNRCSTIVKSGSGKYVETPVIGRTVTISPTTNYNDGWYINWDMVGKKNESIRKSS